MLHFIICDDNHKHNESLYARLEKILKETEIKGFITLMTEDGEEVLRYAQANTDKTNVYLLDINLRAKKTGLDIAAKIREIDNRAYFVFISAYQEYCLLSFKVKTFDFLVKPISVEALEKCLKSLYGDYLGSKDKGMLTIKTGTSLYVIEISTILFFEKFKQILTIHTSNETVQCYDSLEKMQNILLSQGFFRCHKSYLVNLGKIKYIDKKKNLIVMATGQTCYVSRKFKKELLDKMGGRVV